MLRILFHQSLANIKFDRNNAKSYSNFYLKGTDRWE